jgi:hypothetical protein
MKKRAGTSTGMSLSGEQLIGDFLAAMTNRAAAETAHVIAEQSEKDTLQTLAGTGAAPSGYLSPGNIPEPVQQNLVRSSLDAHIKKVQAEQVRALALNQLVQMQAENEAAYLNRKVEIKIIDPSVQPVESYWFHEQTGQESIGVIKKAVVKGFIRTIELDKNLLILEPTLSARLINPARKYFLVYVINPQTLTPTVNIKLV